MAAYRASAAEMSDADRGDSKTGVFIGAYVEVPFSGDAVPVFVADYVLMGYGTGAVMGVPGEDQRDHEFADAYGLPVVHTVQPPPEHPDHLAYTGDGPSINSHFLDGLDVEASKELIVERLQQAGSGRATVNYKMRDWLFSRQRYWGEPIPIVHDEHGPVAVDDDMLPVELPELMDWAPRALARDSEPEPPLGRVADWASVELDVGDGVRQYRRELNTMPQWAGSCWYYLRYLDPDNDDHLVAPEVESYWMADPAAGRRRWRRPVRGRRGACRAAPAVRPVLAQGAVRPGPCQRPRAVQAPRQPGLHPGVRLQGRPRCVCARPTR